MKQSGQAWHDRRKKGIGSSDAPIIMQVSPYSTPFKLWELKTGRALPQEGSNWIQNKGHENEPIARALFELQCDIPMPAELVDHQSIPWLIFSADGINREHKCFLEIKFAGKEDHENAKNEKLSPWDRIPEKYQWQIVHQHMVSELPICKYVSFYKPKGSKGEIVIVDVPRDLEKEKILFAEEKKFWDLVQSDTPPELTEKDFKVIKDTELQNLCELYRSTKTVADSVKDKCEKLKAEIVAYVGKQRARCNGVQIMPIIRKGNIDYEKIPALKGLDLEQFRKKASEYIDVRIMKGDE